MNFEDVSSLPLEIQISLAFGYAAYIFSYTGIRRHHTALDTFFIVLLFSVIALLILRLTGNLGLILSSLIALIVAVVIAIIWRIWLRGLLYKTMRKFNLTWASDDPSAFFTLYANTHNAVSQISIELEDGKILECRDTSLFSNAPHGPCLLGPDGDVALYVTHETDAGGNEVELEHVHDNFYGHLITYVPNAPIRTISIRHMEKT